MKCIRHPEFDVKNIFGECVKCNDEEIQDYKKLRESISEGLKKSGILEIIKTGVTPVGKL
jgi:hypothetical protein